MVYIHNVILVIHKEEGNKVIYWKMDTTKTVILSEITCTRKDNAMPSLICETLALCIHISFIYKMKVDTRLSETRREQLGQRGG